MTKPTRTTIEWSDRRLGPGTLSPISNGIRKERGSSGCPFLLIERCIVAAVASAVALDELEDALRPRSGLPRRRYRPRRSGGSPCCRSRLRPAIAGQTGNGRCAVRSLGRWPSSTPVSLLTSTLQIRTIGVSGPTSSPLPACRERAAEGPTRAAARRWWPQFRWSPPKAWAPSASSHTGSALSAMPEA